jgi:dolichol-phosphate mannosyltransferase
VASDGRAPLGPGAPPSRPLVLVPTFNEQENVERLCEEIQKQGIALDLLFVDDNSTDGTGRTLDALAGRHPSLSVIHRAGKLGIGSAHRAGIKWAYARGYESLVTMDCDFTHDPRHISELLARTTSGADVAVGSRYLRANSLPDWNLYRRSLTTLGHFATRFMLGMSYDATNAYRCYRLSSIPERLFDLVGSSGYSFFFESLYVIHKNGFRIEEIPIALPNRTYGHSKMTSREIRRSLWLLASTFIKSIVSPGRFKLTPSVDGEPKGRSTNRD